MLLKFFRFLAITTGGMFIGYGLVLVVGQLYASVGKRLLDLLISATALIILSPVILVLAILIRLKLGSPIIFSQERPGLYGKPFTMYKFRSMTNALENTPPGKRCTSRYDNPAIIRL